MAIELAYEIENQLGEGPLWDAQAGALYWVDILGPCLQRWTLQTGALRTWTLPCEIGSFALRAGGGALVALRRGLAFLDLESGALTPICDPEAGLSETRFNDGKCDGVGRFWAGTMDESALGNRGALYCLDADSHCRRLRGEVGISNGLGWSPDQRTMYYTDSIQHTIYAYDFDLVRGAISNPRVFVQTPADYVPDGLCVDAEGYLWSAKWDGWKVVRYAPDGSPEREIQLPVQRPTSCCFGGAQLDQLYITSARTGLSPAQLAAQPLAGSVFVYQAPVPGLPVARFAG